MRDSLRLVLAEIFELDPAEVSEDASTLTLAGWDSLRQLELMLALEQEYGVRISAEALLDLDSVPAIEAYLDEQGA